MKKDLAVILGLFLIIVAVLFFGGAFSTVSFLTPLQKGAINSAKKNTSLSVKTLKIDVDVLTTPNERKKGLGGREDLAITRGALFVFESSDIWPIWMKDMKFAIDIIWMDENKKIVYIVGGARPEPGMKDKDLTIYKPGAQAKYILEINAGLANLNNLQVGDSVDFSL